MKPQLKETMKYTKRSVRSRPGLSQEEALESLQSHPQFRPGSKIASIRRRGKVWVADLLEPKVAGPFPPSGDEGPPEEGPSDSGPPEESEGPPPGESGPPDSDGDSDGDGPPDSEGGPPKPEGGEKKGEGGKGGVENQILHTLQQILHALSGGPVDPGMGGPDDLGPDMGGPPAPHGPPGGPGAGGLPPGGAGAGAGAGHSARPLKPGDAPNKPGSVPVGAPAFARTRQANPSLPPPGVPAGGAAPASPGAAPGAGAGVGAGVGSTCPNCHQPEPCSCGYGQGSQGGMSPVGRAATFVARRTANVTVKQAARELQAEYGPHGYKVARIRRDGSVLRALMTRR